MGEYGVANHFTENDKQTQQENMQYYLKCVVSEARSHGFAAFAWDNNAFNNGPENFGIFNRWQNMAVGNTYFLRGITEGAGTEYIEPTPNPDDDDIGQGGMTIWEGDEVLNWGDGLQLSLPATLFENRNSNLQVVIYYTQDYTDYDMFQFFYGDWSVKPTFFVGDSSFDGEFIPSSYYATGSGTSHITPVTFGESTFSIIQNKGLVLQGHGLRLNKVVLNDPTGISTVTKDPSVQGKTYTIDGREVKQTNRPGVYIINGKKYMK